MMNRKMRRLSEAEGRRKQKLEWNRFENVTQDAVAKHLTLNPDSTFRPDFVFQNNRYIVQVFANVPRNGRIYDKVMVRRSDSKPIYSWSDLFRIKNEVLGPEVEAIQFMPKVSELIDQANLYWFWVDVTDRKV